MASRSASSGHFNNNITRASTPSVKASGPKSQGCCIKIERDRE